jgi:hypothetical protein
MEQIYPVSKETIQPYIGKPVCVVLQDETYYQGYICGIENGKLILSEQLDGAGTLSSKRKKKRAKSKLRQHAKADTSAFYPYGPAYGYGYGRLGFDLALIALLFTIPFLGFPFFI